MGIGIGSSDTGRASGHALRLVAAVTLLLSASVGCGTLGARTANAPSALGAPDGLPDAARLDVAVVAFDPGLPSERDDVYPEIRQAESAWLPLRLVKTLEKTEQWGATRLVPAEPIAADLVVTGEILESTGKELMLHVVVRDAAGRVWLDKNYRTEVPSDMSYAVAGDGSRPFDPYQPMFNTIANDMVAARQKRKLEDLEGLRTISELKFAADLSPEAFGGYLATKRNGTVEVRRLPAVDDPMLERTLEVRVRDDMFVDTLRVHYQKLYSDIDQSYWGWREVSNQELRAQERIQKEQIVRGIGAALLVAAAVGAAASGSNGAYAATGIASAIAVQQMQKIQELQGQKRMHQEGVRELSRSLQTEVAPVVVELQSSSVRLTGTAEAQYEEWQRLLRDIYRAENDIVSDVYMVPRQPREEVVLADAELPAIVFEADEPGASGLPRDPTLPPVISPAVP